MTGGPEAMLPSPRKTRLSEDFKHRPLQENESGQETGT